MQLPDPHPEALRGPPVLRACSFPAAARVTQQPQISAVAEQGGSKHGDAVMAMLRLGGTPRGDLSSPVHGWPSMPIPELPLKENGRDFTGGPVVKNLHS